MLPAQPETGAETIVTGTARVRARCVRTGCGGPAATVRPRSAAAACPGVRGAAIAERSQPSPSAGSSGSGARAFIWVGAITLALVGDLPGPLLDRGGLSLARGAGDPGRAVRLRADRRRREDEAAATSGSPQALAAAGVAALYGALFSAVALYDMISKVAAGGGAAALTAFAIGVSLRHGILVAGAGLRRRLRQSRHHRQRDAQHARPVRLSAGDRRRHAGGHPHPRLVAARLGRAGAARAIWTVRLDAADVERPALGRPVPGRGRRPVRVGDLAAPGREREPAVDVAALVWAALGLDRRPARWRVIVRTAASRTSAGWRWRRTASASMRSAAGRRASSTSRRWRRSCRWRRSPCGGSTRAAWRSTDARFAWLAILLRRPLCRRRLRADVERRAAGLLGGARPSPPRSRTSCSAGACCAASRPARRGA